MRSVVLALVFCVAGLAQKPVFAPFAQWVAAVNEGDAKAIAALYSTAPPPALIVSTGVITDVPREATFWAGWKKQHLEQLQVDPIVDQAVSPDLRQIGFEAGLHVVTVNGPQSLYLFVEQTWARQDGAWRIVSGGRSDLSRLKQPTSLDEVIYSKTANATADIAAAEKKAGADHKLVLLDFGGNWCYDCHVLDMAFRRSDLAPLLAANYELVNVDVENFDYNLDIVKSLNLSIMKGVPMLAILSPDGKVLASSQDGSLEQARRLAPADLIRFLTTWTPAAK